MSMWRLTNSKSDYVKNDPNRCFHCKDELFTVLEKFAAERGFSTIVYGSIKTIWETTVRSEGAKLHEVKAPLVDARFDQSGHSGAFRGWRDCLPGSARRRLSEFANSYARVTIENIRTVELAKRKLRRSDPPVSHPVS